MRFNIHFFELLPADMGINLRRGNAGMPQHLLYMPQVGTVIQHHGAGRMAEQVGTFGVTHSPLGVNSVTKPSRTQVRVSFKPSGADTES